MNVTIKDLLTASQLDDIRRTLSVTTFADGRESAGWAAREVKNNTQAQADAVITPVREFLHDALLANPLFALATRPKTVLGPQFSRTIAGQSYGAHIDEPLMSGIRTDVAFTVFLSDPHSYVGGELVIDSAGGEDAIKLAAGSAIVYPATSLHRVAPVTSGERLAAFGWVRSFVRQDQHRELLFDLDTARHRIFESAGKSPEFDLLSKCSANLMRLWCDD